MNARNCRKCGRLFNYAMGPIMCQQCRDALEGKFKEVKDYIQQHPACGIQEVSRECDVETSQIQQWLREERLEFTADSMVQLNCEGCGAPIRSGRYCDSCKTSMTNGFNQILRQAAPPPPTVSKDPKDSPKMRYLN
ncbi:MAG: flagellar protein [Lachnospiraceae bacterium]|nr:flagellar protein [Lachnospiraceae bacterium]